MTTSDAGGTGLDPEEVRLLIEYRDDRSQAEAWRAFNEVTRRLDRDLTRATTPGERLLSMGWLAGDDPSGDG